MKESSKVGGLAGAQYAIMIDVDVLESKQTSGRLPPKRDAKCAPTRITIAPEYIAISHGPSL